ncbi:MAG: hypothetical protein NTX15_11350 [Candidatus Kapabacteria bacterium]|nr:hypothetical protein [Candidatus Kapabacteria bacterium]
MLIVCATNTNAQWQSDVCDTVLRFTPGTGQTNGQGPVFFPANVLRGPSRIATEYVPDTDPREICSLGLGGSIVLGYRSAALVDGQGADFIVVENTFRYSDQRVYAEPAHVEVSADGVLWKAFPFDSATLVGCAGITPLGDSFDLALIGVDSVRWIRLTDVTSIIIKDPKHAYYDPTLSGFDLDVVIGLHTTPKAFASALTDLVLTSSVRIDAALPGTTSIYDVRGAVLYRSITQAGVWFLDMAFLPSGAYFVVLDDGVVPRTLKVLR